MAELTSELLKEKILLNPQLYTMNNNIHKGILEKFLTENKALEAIWTNDSDGRFIYSRPPNQIINANVRAWFKAEIAEKSSSRKFNLGNYT